MNFPIFFQNGYCAQSEKMITYLRLHPEGVSDGVSEPGSIDHLPYT